MKNTNWNQIESGQIVKFLYKGLKSQRSLLREVIVLDPRFLYRKKSTGRIIELFIGLEIDNQDETFKTNGTDKRFVRNIGNT